MSRYIQSRLTTVALKAPYNLIIHSSSSHVVYNCQHPLLLNPGTTASATAWCTTGTFSSPSSRPRSRATPAGGECMQLVESATVGERRPRHLGARCVLRVCLGLWLVVVGVSHTVWFVTVRRRVSLSRPPLLSLSTFS